MKSDSKKFRPAVPLCAVFCLSPFIIGVYYEWLSCIVSIMLIGFLCYCRIAAGKIKIPLTPLMAACSVIVIFFAISPLWAVDKGMTVLGAVKFLPLPLFCISIAQTEIKSREKMLLTIPAVGALMTVGAFLLSRISRLSGYFLVSGRLSGFFQYSNTFAAYLLVGLIIAVSGYKKTAIQMPVCAILLFGIFMSGSRTVFILLALSVLLFIIFIKNKKTKLLILGIFAFLTVFAAIFAVVTDRLDTIGRFLTSSLNSSTFIGRILYYKDALPVILKHPLGLGYMGYYFLQGSFKTGVYTVVNIHNDFLQILLDIGWLPFAICLWAAVKAFIKCPPMSKAVIAAILSHCLLDFDLQYISVCFVLIAAMSDEPKKFLEIRSKSAISLCCIAATALQCYFGIAAGLYYFNDYSAAAKIYPAYTSAYVEMISYGESIEEMDALADEIFKYNDSVSIAHSIKGRAAFARGDVESMIEYMRGAVLLSRYRIDEYRDYRDMLKLAINAYENAGDENSAEYCREYLAEIYMILKRTEQTTSPLAWKIDVKPILEMD